METDPGSQTFFCHADAGVAISPAIRPVLHRIFLSKGKHRGAHSPNNCGEKGVHQTNYVRTPPAEQIWILRNLALG